jgi:hypothetical protein
MESKNCEMMHLVEQLAGLPMPVTWFHMIGYKGLHHVISLYPTEHHGGNG